MSTNLKREELFALLESELPSQEFLSDFLRAARKLPLSERWGALSLLLEAYDRIEEARAIKAFFPSEDAFYKARERAKRKLSLYLQDYAPVGMSEKAPKPCKMAVR